MEKFCIHALESVVRSSEWEQEFLQFYRSVSPRFEGFDDHRINDTNTGKGLDMLMFDAYSEYQKLFDGIFSQYLSDMGISFETFETFLQQSLQRDDSSAQKLLEALTIYEDFELFGVTMQRKFDELYPSSKKSSTSDEKLSAAAPPANNNNSNSSGSSSSGRSTSDHSLSAAMTAEEKRHQSSDVVSSSTSAAVKSFRPFSVRVLWDIENIPVPAAIGGMETVSRLHEFLQAHGLAGNGIDSRITAFFRPNTVSNAIVRDLDKASVELVWVATKREDADRKINTRISQEIMVLEPQSSAFVLITSDQDFRTQAQLLGNKGFKVVVIHRAQTDKWTKALEMYASESYRWDDLITRDSDGEVNLDDRFDHNTAGGGGGGGGTRDAGSKRRYPSARGGGRGQGQQQQQESMATGTIAADADAQATAGMTMTYLDVASSTSGAAAAAADAKDGNSSNSFDATSKSYNNNSSNSGGGRGRGRGQRGGGGGGGGGGGRVHQHQHNQHQNRVDREVVEISPGWYRGTCIRWYGAYGFIAVTAPPPPSSTTTAATPSNNNSSHNTSSVLAAAAEPPVANCHSPRGRNDDSAGTVRVYVHNKALKGLDCLQRGQCVRAYVEMAEKGPKATTAEAVLD